MSLAVAQRITTLAALGLVLASPRPAAACAFGQAGVDHYIVAFPTPAGVEIDFDAKFGALPTAAIRARHDRNRNGILDPDEILDYIERVQSVYLKRIEVQFVHNGRRTVAAPRFPYAAMARNTQSYVGKCIDNMDSLRIRWRLIAPWPADLASGPPQPVGVKVRSLIRLQNLCSRMVVGEPGAPTRILAATLPTWQDLPRPPDVEPPIADIALIPRVQAGSFLAVTGPYNGPTPDLNAFMQSDGSSAPSAPAADAKRVALEAVRNLPGAPTGASRIERMQERIRAALHGLFDESAGRFSWALAILLCFARGAVHAFLPGHGKTVVSATLVGMQARYRHAVVMGALITLTHTALVLILAYAAILLEDRFTYPTWLRPLGAIVILLVGVNQIRIGLTRCLTGKAAAAASAEESAGEEAHSHWGFFRHSHAPARLSGAREPSAMRDAVAIGATGGLVPCPAAIVTLLLLWSVAGRILALLCLISFSLGLATALMGLGFAAVAGARFVERLLSARSRRRRIRLDAVMPLLGGCVLMFLGWILLRMTP
jgi:ABC-type nickel/cobalt efflux system permease component RcnA